MIDEEATTAAGDDRVDAARGSADGVLDGAPAGVTTRNDHTQQRLARIALGHLVEPGNRDLGELVDRVGAVEAGV